MVEFKEISMCLLLLGLLMGCAAPAAHRSDLVDAAETKVRCNPTDENIKRDCANITPEISSDANYELHFVEFDDQGWEYDVRKKLDVNDKAKAETQTDHLMKRLRYLLDEEKKDLNIVLYVHGWKHNAEVDDKDVIQFRRLLSLQSRLEQHTHTSIGGTPRKVVGIYVGWNGKGGAVSRLLPNLTFWTRKAAALRISRGSVIDLFSRMQSLQQDYNGWKKSPACNPDKQKKATTKQCRIRSLMVGHSFGGWILYSALSGSIIEALNASRDLDGSTQKTSALIRPADLVILINPAFEAVRYEPIHRAAMAYRAVTPQPPMLVSITSVGDAATRLAFPAGRLVNTIFQRTGSDDQLLAMTRTHGHLERLHTHHLTSSDHKECPHYESPDPISNEAAESVIKKNNIIESKAFRRFGTRWRDEGGLLRHGWIRYFCGGAVLTQLGRGWSSEGEQESKNENSDPNSLIWNIRADRSIIKDHSSITNTVLLEFIHQLYDDTAR